MERKIKCSSCDGKGYWPEARSLACNGTCTVCNGDGEVIAPEYMKKAPPKTTILTVGELRKKLRGLNSKAHIIRWSNVAGEYRTAFKVVEFGKGKRLTGLEIQFY